jgi:hypothetical protein
MLTKVWSGGQDGAEIAGLRVATAVGIKTGGWIAKGWRTHSGSHPEYATLYGVIEHASPLYPPRTACNIRDTDATFILGDNPHSPSCALTRHYCERYGKPFICVSVIQMVASSSAERAAGWLQRHHIEGLNIAGNRDIPAEVLDLWLRHVFVLSRGESR